jgi:hypothetical protein
MRCSIDRPVLITTLLSFLIVFSSFNLYPAPVKAAHLVASDIDAATGCRKNNFVSSPAAQILDTKNTMIEGILSYLRLYNPEWVPVDRTDPQVAVEGTVQSSWVSENDFLLDHTGHDKNFDLLVDDKYANLATTADHIDPAHADPNISVPVGHANDVEVEWDMGNLNGVNVPTDYWPSEGDRAWTMGRWVYDCSHDFGPPQGVAPSYTTEIHPASATAFSHTEAVIFSGMHAPSLATVTHLYIHGRGGYYDTPVPATIDKHYSFDIPLPPQPSMIRQQYVAAHAEVLKTDFDASTVPPPTLTIVGRGGDVHVHVDYDLSSVTPSPDNKFGVVIASGWLTPQTTQDYRILKASVTGITINNCQGCNNWSMWADIGSHWVYLGTFKSSTPDIKIGDCFNHGRCTPAGFIPLTQDPSNVTLIVPTQFVPSSPSNTTAASSVLFQTNGYSWSNNEGNFGIFPAPNTNVFSNMDVPGNIANLAEIFKRANVDSNGLLNILYGVPLKYRGLTYNDAVTQFISDGILGMKVFTIHHHFGPETNFGVGSHNEVANPQGSPNGNYTIQYNIQDMGTIPKGTQTGWVPNIFNSVPLITGQLTPGPHGTATNATSPTTIFKSATASPSTTIHPSVPVTSSPSTTPVPHMKAKSLPGFHITLPIS